MIIQKFGGTSIGSTDRIKKLAEIIRQGERTIVVLSAMGGTTNALVEIVDLCRKKEFKLAYALAENLKNKYSFVVNELFSTVKEARVARHFIKKVFVDLNSEINSNTINEKKILAIGELLSTRLFYLYLQELGENVVYLSAFEFMRLNKDNEPDEVYLEENLVHILNGFSNKKIFITQGFICMNEDDEIDNLGRGGSDYSATLIGSAIKAKEIQIWTDVDGIQNNDPRFVEDTKPVRQISFDEAAELAYFGAKILHPQSVLPAKNKGIPVLLKNTLDPNDEGTIISGHLSGSGFKAVAAKDKITAIRIKSGRMLMAYGFIRKVFEVFEKYHTPVDMITTSEVAVSVTIDCDDQLEEIVRGLKDYGSVTVDTHQTIVAVVGELVADQKGYANQLFASLKDIPIRMISYGASKHNISFLVGENDKVETLQAIHHGIFNKKLMSYAE